MAELIRKERFLGGEKIIVGDKRTDIILETLGKVYIKSGNSSRLLNDVITAVDKLSNSDISQIIILQEGQTTDSIEYPGDGKLIYDGTILYITLNETYIPLVDKGEGENYVKKAGDTMTGQLTIELEDQALPPLVVNSTTLVTGLNAEYISGEKLDKYTNREKDEDITGSWKFNDLSSRNITANVITSDGGFASGMAGYGWQIDSNTLTIDNVIVRKTLQLLNNAEDLYQSVVNGTNSNLWLGSALTITKVTPIEVVEQSIREITTTLGVKNVYYSGIFNNEVQPLCSGFDTSGNPVVEPEPLLDLTSTTNGLYNFYDYFQGGFLLIEYTGYGVEVNNIYRCQAISGEKIRYYDCVITSVPDTNLAIVRCSESINDVYIKDGQKIKNNFSKNILEEIPGEQQPSEEENVINYVETPAENDILTLIGNLSGNFVGVYLSTIDDYSPSITVLENVGTPDYQAQDTLNSKLGRLDGILDPDIQPTGVGLYTKNLNARTKNWIISNGVIKYIGGGGLILNDSGLLDTVTPSTSPFSTQVEDYIKSMITEGSGSVISELRTEIQTLKTQIASLEARLTALENK